MEVHYAAAAGAKPEGGEGAKRKEDILKTAAIIQARMGSTRLPGKAMLPVLEKPILQWMIERVKAANCCSEIIIATTPSSKEIQEHCKKNRIEFYVGSEDDVMSRVIDCANFYRADIILDLTSDCPLVDPRHMNFLVQAVKGSLNLRCKLNYVSNINPRSFPDGFDCQCYYIEWLKAASLITTGNLRQHTGWNILRNFPERCSKSIQAKGIYNWPGLRLTLDYPEDFETLRTIIEYFYYRWEVTTAEEIIDFVIDYPRILKNRKLLSKQPGE